MASELHIPEAIRQEAARWLTERDAGLLSADDEQAMDDWLAANPVHAAAYARVKNSWDLMDAMPPMAGVRLLADTRASRRKVLPLPWMAGAIAACLALIVVGGVYDWPIRLRADAVTATGERRSVPLADGSVVELNTNSAIAVDYHAERRIVRLLKGEAAFSVAPDRLRPFTVEAGNGSTTALGTRFIVRRDGAETVVTVTEHRVRVDWREAGGERDAQVREGEVMHYGESVADRPHRVDVDAMAAWTRGHLVFVNEPLGQVVAELNRYHPGYIRVVGSSLERRRFSGVLPVSDPMGALEAIQQSLGIGSTRVTDRLIFLHG